MQFLGRVSTVGRQSAVGPSLALLSIAATVLLASPSHAAEPVAWRTGAELQRHLAAASLKVTWSEISLRQALTGLAERERVAIMLDRRVAPEQKLAFAADNVKIDRLLEALAEKKKLGVCLVDPVFYIGPPEVARKLATLVEVKRDELRGLPEDARLRLARTHAWRWEALATPRELIEELATQAGIQVLGLEQIPHDLWPAGDLPPLSFASRLSLVLAGFGLTFEFAPDGSAVRLTPMPDAVSLRRSYSVPVNARGRAAELARMFPETKIEAEGTDLVVDGSLEDHVAIRDLLQGKTVRRTVKVGEPVKTYSMTVQDQPVGSVAASIAKQLGVELKYEPELLPKLKERVSFDANDASLEELFALVLDGAALTYQLDESTLKIVPK